MIDFVKNKKLLEEEKEKFRRAETCEEYEEIFEQLLDRREDDPEFSPLVKEYRDVNAWLTRYTIKEQALGIDFFEAMRDTRDKYNRLIDLEKEILKRHYQRILRQES